MIFIAKLIMVKLDFETFIPVNETDSNLAIKKAKDEFYSEKLTREFFEKNDISFEEINIKQYGEMMAEFYVHNHGLLKNPKSIKDFFYKVWGRNPVAKYIYDEYLDALARNHDIGFEKFKI